MLIILKQIYLSLIISSKLPEHSVVKKTYTILSLILQIITVQAQSEEAMIESSEYQKRQTLRHDLMMRIEKATRKRCPHRVINGKVISLCHGEELWRKKVDCDHQRLLKVSEFYHQSIKPITCRDSNSFSQIVWKKNGKDYSIDREGIFFWLSENPHNVSPPYSLIPIDIDISGDKKRAKMYTVITKPNVRNRPICNIQPDEIIDVVEFHDPNCDLEILSETPLINFIHYTDNDIYQIFQSLDSLSEQTGGCISSLSDLLLLKERDCLAYNPRFTDDSSDPFVEYSAGTQFLEKIKANSHAGAAMDFSSGNRVSGKRHTFYIYDGKVFNYRDFGNFLWGLAYRLASCDKGDICQSQTEVTCEAKFLDKKIALAGANLNAFLKTYKENVGNAVGCSSPPVEGEEENTIVLMGDSSPDQAAIKLGLTHPVGNFILEAAKESYCKAKSEL